LQAVPWSTSFCEWHFPSKELSKKAVRATLAGSPRGTEVAVKSRTRVRFSVHFFGHASHCPQSSHLHVETKSTFAWHGNVSFKLAPTGHALPQWFAICNCSRVLILMPSRLGQVLPARQAPQAVHGPNPQFLQPTGAQNNSHFSVTSLAPWQAAPPLTEGLMMARCLLLWPVPHCSPLTVCSHCVHVLHEPNWQSCDATSPRHMVERSSSVPLKHGPTCRRDCSSQALPSSPTAGLVTDRFRSRTPKQESLHSDQESQVLIKQSLDGQAGEAAQGWCSEAAPSAAFPHKFGTCVANLLRDL